MFISFENEKDCVVARDFINQNLTNLNQAFQNNVYFVDRPNQANCFSYENKVKERILGQPPSGSTFVSPLFPSRKTPLLSNNMGQDSNNMAQHPNNMPNQEEYLLGTVPSGALTFYQNANYPSLSPSNFEKSPMGFYDKDVSQRSRIQSQRQVNKSMGVAQEQSAE